MILDPMLEAERYARPDPAPPIRPRPVPQKPALAVLLYGDCSACTARPSLRLDGGVRAHYRHVDGRVTDDRCPGSGQKPRLGLFPADGAS